MASKSDFITLQRTATRNLITALNDHINLKRQFDALGYLSASTGILDADFVGDNAGILAAEFKQAIAAGAEFNAVFSAGGTVSANSDSKLYKLR